MELQTPHPTIQSQSQTFKLPSSSPQPSPRPLSPVPALIPPQTSSKYSKENVPRRENDPQATSTPWSRHASKSFASGIPSIPPFSRKSRPRSGRHRPTHSHSRSSSNSHSNASSRANSKEPYMRKANIQNHTQPALGLGQPTTMDSGPQIPKGKKSRKATAATRPLASPFVSRAPSPADNMPNNAHIVTQPLEPRVVRQYTSARRRSAVLTNVSFGPNIPVNPSDIQPQSGSRTFQTTPEKVPHKHTFTQTKQAKKGAKTALEKRIYAPSLQLDHALKRRPSAPSTLRLPKQLRQSSMLGPGWNFPTANEPMRESGPHEELVNANRIVVSEPTDKAVTAKPIHKSGLHAFLDRLRHPDSKPASTDVTGPPTPASAPGHQRPAPGLLMRPSASMHDLHAYHPRGELAHTTTTGDGEGFRQGGVDDDARTAWMRGRGGVDFNRPPSQMSFVQAGGRDFGGGCEYPGDEEWEDTLFSSSGESSCGEEVEQDQVCRSSENERIRERAPGEDGPRRYACAQSMKLKSVNLANNTHASGTAHRRLSYEESSLRGRAREAITFPHPAHDSGMGGLGAPFGFGFGFGFGLGGALELADAMHVDEALFGGDAYEASTPAGGWKRKSRWGDENEEGHAHLRRPLSLPSLRIGEALEEEEEGADERRKLTKSVSAEELRKKAHSSKRGEGDWEEDDDGEEDMELTGSAVVGGIMVAHAQGNAEDRENDHEKNADREISWITDSVISAPTAYLHQKRRRAEEQGQCDIGTDEEDGRDSDKTQRGAPSSSGCSSLFEYTLAAPFDDGHQESAADKGQLIGEGEPDVGTATTTTAKRTRSGTIVPANPLSAGVPPGARRTRSGTIVGPLPPAPPPSFGLPAIPGAAASEDAVGGPAYSRVGAAPTRTRSGTIIASVSVVRPAAGLDNGPRGRARSGSVLRMRTEQNAALDHQQESHHNERADIENTLAGQEEEQDHIVECYADSLYLPALAESSPDPLDFLRFAGIAEAEEDEDVEWRVVREPPSPSSPKRKRRKVGLGLATRAANAGRWLKAKSKLTARFASGADGEEEAEHALGDTEAGELGDVESSDDELLLVSGSTVRLWK